MFSLRYFNPRYWTPRYFAERGGVFPPTYGSIRVLVRQVDRSDYLSYRDTISFNHVRGNRGTCSLPFYLVPGDGFAPQYGDYIEIFDPFDVRAWAGFAEDVSVKFIGDKGHRVRSIAGIGIESLFDANATNNTRLAGMRCGDAIAQLYALSGITRVTLGRIDNGPVLKSMEVSNYWQGFQQIAVIAGYICYIDHTDLTLNFHAPAALDPNITIHSEDVRWESSEWKQSGADRRSTQQVIPSGTSLKSTMFTDTGDGVQTDFTLPLVPAYLVSVALSVGTSEVSWSPGSAVVRFDPAPEDGATVTIGYADTSAAAAAGIDSAGIAARAAVYTRTRTFTQEGAEQEAAAILARYSLMPSQFSLVTDKPGIRIGPLVNVDLEYPVEAGDLENGHWMVQELQAAIVPGLELKPEPYGHFRYTARMINSSAAAVIQADGESTDYQLPEVPGDTPSILVWNGGDDPNNPPNPYDPDNPNNPYPYTTTWDDGTWDFSVDPAPPDWATIIADYTPATFVPFQGDGSTEEFQLPETPKEVKAIEVYDVLPDPISAGNGTLNPDTYTTFWGGADTVTVSPAPPEDTSVLVRMVSGRAPDVPSFVDTMNQLADKGTPTPPLLGDTPQPDSGGGGGGGQTFIRTATIYDMTVRDTAAPMLPVYADGTGSRLQIVLTETLLADAEIRINKGGSELITFTIPDTTPTGTTLDIPMLVGSPPALPSFVDDQVLSIDILASGGEKNRLHGVMSISVEWTS